VKEDGTYTQLADDAHLGSTIGLKLDQSRRATAIACWRLWQTSATTPPAPVAQFGLMRIAF
jgi:hypothetical protein